MPISWVSPGSTEREAARHAHVIAAPRYNASGFVLEANGVARRPVPGGPDRRYQPPRIVDKPDLRRSVRLHGDKASLADCEPDTFPVCLTHEVSTVPLSRLIGEPIGW